MNEEVGGVCVGGWGTVGSLLCHGQEVNALTGQERDQRMQEQWRAESVPGRVCPQIGDSNHKPSEAVLGAPWARGGSQWDCQGDHPCEHWHTLAGGLEAMGVQGWEASQEPSPPDELAVSSSLWARPVRERAGKGVWRGFC